MKNLIENLRDLSLKSAEKASGLMNDGQQWVEKQFGQLRFLASSEQSNSYGDQQTDEKHYFLIPFHLSEVGYTFYSMRVLPDGVPPINNLPKKRIFHFPNEQCNALVEDMMLQQVREQYQDVERPSGDTVGDRFIGIANEIDKVDSKVTHGMLLVGGLVALLNPIAGAGLAAKALIPGLGGRLSKYGLKNVGAKWNQVKLAQEIKKAEQQVLAEFRGAETQTLLNPLLRELDTALRTTQAEHDPLLEFNFQQQHFDPADNTRFIHLTCTAIGNTYAEVLSNKKLWAKASLGPEDVCWLTTILKGTKPNGE